MSSIVCTLCGQQGHKMSKCKELNPPKKDEFFSGGGSCGGGHSHDEDDEKARLKKLNFEYNYIRQTNIKNNSILIFHIKKTFLP